MDQLRGILRTALAQRLGQHLESLRQGPDVGDVPVASGLLEALLRPSGAALGTLGLAREGLGNISKAGTGFTEVANARLNPFLALFPDAPGSQMARQALAGYDAGPENPVAALLAANEAGAAGHGFAQGLVNLAHDPTTYLPGGGGSAAAREAQQAGRIAGGLGIDLAGVNAILGGPELLAGHFAGRAASPALRAIGNRMADRLGVAGADEGLGLMARLRQAQMPTDPAERAAWQARYAGQSQAGTDILARGDEVAGTGTTQADLNGMAPGDRMAALRGLLDQGDQPTATGTPREISYGRTAHPDVQSIIDDVIAGVPDTEEEIFPSFGAGITPGLAGKAKKAKAPRFTSFAPGGATPDVPLQGPVRKSAARSEGGFLVEGLEQAANQARRLPGFSPSGYPADPRIEAEIVGASRIMARGLDRESYVAEMGRDYPNLRPEQLSALYDESIGVLGEYAGQLVEANRPTVERMAGLINKGINANPEARGWYEGILDNLHQMFGSDAPLLMEFLAITSPRNRVDRNALEGLQALIEYRTGHQPGELFDYTLAGAKLPGLRKAFAGEEWGDLKIQDFINSFYESYIEQHGDEAFGSGTWQRFRQQWEQNPVATATTSDTWHMRGMGYADAPRTRDEMRAALERIAAYKGKSADLQKEAKIARLHLDTDAFPDQYSPSYPIPITSMAPIAQTPTLYKYMKALGQESANYMTRTTGEEWTPREAQAALWFGAKQDWVEQGLARSDQLQGGRFDSILKDVLGEDPEGKINKILAARVANPEVTNITKQRSQGLVASLGGLPSGLTPGSLAGGGVGGVLGGAAGALAPADDNQDRFQNIMTGASIGGTIGGGVGGRLGEDGLLGVVPQITRQARGPLKWLTGNLASGGPPVSRLGVTGSGGLIGAAAGGLAPAESDEERRQHALQGAAVGGALGLGATTGAGRSVLRGVPAAGTFAKNLLGEAWTAQKEAMGRESQGVANWKTMSNIWRVQTTSTLRNILQDFGTSTLWLANAKVRNQFFRDNLSSLVQLYNAGERSGFDALPQDSQDFLTKWGKAGYEPQVGASFNEVNKGIIDKLSAWDTALGEGLLSAADPRQGGVPLLGAGLGVAKGYTRAFQQSIYGTLDSFIKVAGRHAAFQDEADKAMTVAATDFLDHLTAIGVNPTGLDVARGFDATDVERRVASDLLGRGAAPAAAKAGAGAAARDWQELSDRAIKLGEDRAQQIFGNFERKLPGEAGLGKVVPFVSWALRAYPRTAQMMLDHPGISIALTVLMLDQGEQAKEQGLPGYLAGTVPVSEDAPLLGGIATALNGGRQGLMRANLLGALSPVGGSMFAEGDDLPPDANLYQRGVAALGRTGFGPNPLITALAAATNKDYRQPGALSRTGAVEEALPGLQVPSLLHGAINVARKAAGGNEFHTTGLDRALAGLYFQATGHPIGDPGNMADPARAQLLADTTNPDSEIYQAAQRQALVSGAAKTATSLTSPVTLSGQTDQQLAAQAARAEVAQRPAAVYDPQEIAQMDQLGIRGAIDAFLMERANAGTQADLPPELLVNRGASGDARLAALAEGPPSLWSQNSYYQATVGQDILRQLLGLR